MQINMTTIKTSSDGIWQGDNPLNFAFPLLIIQTTIVLLISRSLALLLKPLRQPKVIAEIVGGVLLGPSALGRNKDFLRLIFPSWSTPIFESVASIGLLFFLFLVGLELDLSSIRRSGKRAFGIAMAGISLPFLFGVGVGVTFLLRKTKGGSHDEENVSYIQCLMFMGVSLSITAFPVLARILAELKLLTTQVGQTAMAAAAFNDVAAWILLALAIALAGSGDGGGGDLKNILVSVWVLLSGFAFVAFMLTIIRPAMHWISRRCSPDHDFVDEGYIFITLAGVMISGFTTDLIGIHAIFGAFIFGLTIPKKGPFAGRLIKRIEDFVSGLLLPLYFASSGLKTDIGKIRGMEAWGMLVLVISTACAGKILGTLVVAMMCTIPFRDSLALGVLMNTRGLVELIVLNIGKEKKVLNDEMFAVLVLMALFTTFMTTPTIMAIYKPVRGVSSHFRRRLQPQSPLTADDNNEELRVLACVHGPGNTPSLINLIESTRTTKKSLPIKLYVMHLVELTDRSSSIIMVQQARKNGFPFIKRFKRGCKPQDQVTATFEAYSQLGQVVVRPVTAISALPTMHEDICHVAENKRVTMIILPFHRQWIEGGEGGEKDEIEAMVEKNVGLGWRRVNQRVLNNGPCTVAVLVDRGFGSGSKQRRGTNASVARRVCIVFFGGPDDREALELGGRMADHPAVSVTVVRFIEIPGLVESHCIMELQPSMDKCKEQSYSFPTAPMNRERETELDDAAVADFQRKWEGYTHYIEKVASNTVEEVQTLGRSGEYELIIVGKGRFPTNMAAELADCQVEHAELGPIGDVLASPIHGIVSSVLVIQQYDAAHVDETPVSTKIVHNDNNHSTLVSDESSV